VIDTLLRHGGWVLILKRVIKIKNGDCHLFTHLFPFYGRIGFLKKRVIVTFLKAEIVPDAVLFRNRYFIDFFSMICHHLPFH
jgi:hypothetical protein